MNTKNMTKKKQRTKKAGLIAVIVLTALAVIYIGFSIFFQTHFCFGTKVGGISVGGRSAEGVEELIRQEIDTYVLTLLGREDAVETIAGSDIGITPVFHGEVERLLEEQKGYAWIATLFLGQELEIDKVISYDEEALSDVIEALDMTAAKNQRAPVDAAYSEYDEATGYRLVPADYGTTIDRKALKKAASAAITSLTAELDLSASGCYVNPKVGDDDEKLLTLLADLNRYVATTITYEFGDKTELLDAEITHEWLGDKDGVIAVDEEAVLAYVKGLGKTYNTAYKPKEFKTSYGKTITITSGFYGWKIDNSGEVSQILEDLAAGEAVTREPVYSQTANSHGANDYGNSYVEINLTAQHLFLYKNGKMIVESDFVSGNVAKGHTSPSGAFGLTYKTTNAILRGSDYATPVTYWMPFAGDVGMHDATWRKSFGGSIYKTNGSHGCINLPYSAAKTIYENIEKGFPVLVYTLPGTESTTVQQQDATAVINQINAIGTVTLESEAAIVNARNLYNALADSAKAYVTNIDTLTAAEAALAALKAGQAAEQPVVEQPVVEQPAEQPVEQPVEQQPVEQPVEQQPVEQPVEQQPVEQPMEQQPMVEEPVAEQPTE